MKNINWENSFWFFDIDDTLSDTSTVSCQATEGIRKVFEKFYGKETALAVKNKVNDCYELMYQGYNAKDARELESVPGGKKAFDELLKTVEAYQPSVVREYGMVKKWSREVFVKMAADDLGIEVKPELVRKAVDEYWVELSRVTKAFSDALKLLGAIRSHSRPIYLLTSSDARLKMQSDGKFSYDPVHSEKFKRNRIEMLREKGIDFDALSIGDPEDKPHLDFFDKGMKKAAASFGSPIDLSNSVMVGDSFGGDLKTPKEKMGFGLVVLVNRLKDHFEIEDERQINTSDLGKIVEVIK